MCGRYTLTASLAEVREHFALPDSGATLAPRVNIAPTERVPAVRAGPGGRELTALRWGLVPAWAKAISPGLSMFNARAETVDTRPAFRAAFRRRRCLIPADGFYEWLRADGKQPYRFTVGGGVFALAGLWEHWRGPAGQEVASCAIVVTEANALVAQVHERMPVIVQPRDYDLWLDPRVTDPGLLRPLLVPYPAAGMQAYPVTRKVNRAGYEGPDALAPVGPALTRPGAG